ncbi:Tn3 family transposase [Parashewanella curva]|uniref:Tn3 family transposase n=1 Tax=Parashewanella curva TaxID=2338552 RepID=A0A3L8PRG7_9GAMM|nr:Tn3 family transposase [Parashewanella curva]RLV57975.1 Tn3 family transposase [Parashewanella curva]
MARLNVLSVDEIDALYGLPSNLEDNERHDLFQLESDDAEYIETLTSVADKIDYVLQLGYFYASGCFFQFSFQKVKADVKFILQQYFPTELFPKKQISKQKRYQNRSQIYQKLGLRDADEYWMSELLAEAKRLAKLHALPKFLITNLLSYCQQHRIVKPSYSAFQLLISEALNAEQSRLFNIIYKHTDTKLQIQLDKLLTNDDLLYQLTLLKKDQKNFSTTEIKTTVEKQQLIVDVYYQTKSLLEKLKISEQNIHYYAELAEYYTIQKLQRFRPKNKARLYLLCYIQLRLRKINDQLISSFIHKILKYVQLGNEYQRQQIDIAEAIDKKLRNQAHKVMLVNIDDEVPDVAVREQAFQIVPKVDFKQFLSDFQKPNFDRDFYRWQMFGRLGRRMKRNIRPIFMNIGFSCDDAELTKAIDFLKQHIAEKRAFKRYSLDQIPFNFFPKSHRKFLMNENSKLNNVNIGVIDGDRYEFMVYWQLQKRICDIAAYVKHSNSYRALEDELIALEQWEKQKDSIIAELNMPMLSCNIVDILNHLEDSVETQFTQVNQRIRDGSNSCIKLKYNKKNEFTHWTLPYKPIENGVNNTFFNNLSTMSIAELAQIVDKETEYSKVFTHIQPKYSKQIPEIEAINACLVANATGIEFKKMVDISDIKGQTLKHTNDSYIRVQTLRSANDLVVNKTAKLSIFKEYNLSDYGVHASIDGQKLATRYHTIKARYSKKYFGLNQGIVSIVLNANHLPINLKAISANEHESHYLVDLVESNTSEINVAAVSGDMHSINRVNFALMQMFGYQFMPRFTRLADKSKTRLVGFREVDDYSHHIIKPSKKVNRELIIKEWDKVLRILASIAMKKTTQASIIRKLSTTSAMSPVLKAMIALDEIIMTDYILSYIDSEEKRTVVQRSLNRGESYHQLSSTIARVNGGRMLNGKTEIELSINLESIRLLANIIIYHNAAILSGLYEYYSKIDVENSKAILNFSPVSWHFINLIGSYEFYRGDSVKSIQEQVEKLIEVEKQGLQPFIMEE